MWKVSSGDAVRIFNCESSARELFDEIGEDSYILPTETRDAHKKRLQGLFDNFETTEEKVLKQKDYAIKIEII